MAGEELDDDLQDLLNQLDDQEVEPSEPEPKSNGESDEPLDLAASANALTPIEDLAPTDVRNLESPIPQVLAAESSEEPEVDLHKYLVQLDTVTKEVLQACQSDRAETQDVINMLRRRIDDAINTNSDPSRMYIDGLVKAVEVKAGINATAVKMTESIAKMIASTRSGINITNQNANISSGELDDLLKGEVPDDLD